MRFETLGVVLLLLAGAPACDAPERDPRTVLVLEGESNSGEPSPEAQAAVKLWLAVHAVTAAQWSAMRPEEFRGYRAIVIGESACQPGSKSLQAVKRTQDTWEPAVNGTRVIVAEEWTPNRLYLDPEGDIRRASGSSTQTGLYLGHRCGPLSELASQRAATVNNPPVAWCKEDFSVAATTQCGVANVNIDYGSYDSDGDLVGCTQNPTGLLPIGMTPVTLTCTDRQDATDSCITYVTVTDATVPSIQLEGDASPTVECGSPYRDPGATASNPCQDNLTNQIVKTGSVDVAVRGTHVLTYDVQDHKGQHAPTVTRTVTVQDNQPPSIQCPPNVSVEGGSDGWADVTLPPPTATDSCSNVTVSGGPSGTRFAVGTTSVTYTARDAVGKEASCSVSVTVNPSAGGGPAPIKDGAMLGGGCGATTGNGPSVCFALMALAVSWSRLASRRSKLAGRVLARRLGSCLTVAALVLSAPASAQLKTIPAFELERLRLNSSGMGSWVVGTGELLPAGGYRLALAGHYENRPLMLYQDGVLQGAIVRHRVTTLLSGAMGLGGRVELGAQVPLLLAQQGDDLTDRNVRMPQGGVALGTPLITARLSLLAEHQEDPVNLAVGFSASPGIGSAAALARELQAIPNVMLGRSLGQVRASLDAGLMLRPSKVLTPDENVQDEVGHALRFGAGLASIGEGLGGEVAAIGSVPLKREGFSLELLSGVRVPVGERLELHGLAGLGLGNAPGIPRFRVVLGMAFGKVARPPAPAPAVAAESPEYQDKDWDRDGVLNWVDDCPEVPGPPERRGCPVLDSDGDGVTNEKDKCPRQKGIVEMAGCPRKDTDEDTVWDHEDNCREIPGPPENQGCPSNDRQLVVIQRRRIAIKDTIHFDYDKDTIKSISFPLLNQVAQVLNEHPEIVSVSIEGHTDDSGSNAYNRDLALRRAGSVRTYLEGKGVARSRMSVRGFGEDRPLTTNATEEGRAINRRVEFITRYESEVP